MELRDTIELMNSDNHEDRFKAEFYQLKIRIEKLSDLIHKYQNGTLDFKPKTPLINLKIQLDSMRMYFRILKARARIEGIELD